jgi:hypothetical protein
MITKGKWNMNKTDIMIEALQGAKELIGNGIAIINDNAPSGTQAEISTVYSKILQALAKAGIK